MPKIISETKKTKTSSDSLRVVKGDEANLLDAASQVCCPLKTVALPWSYLVVGDKGFVGPSGNLLCLGITNPKKYLKVIKDNILTNFYSGDVT